VSEYSRRRRSIFDIIDEYFESLETWAERVRETVMERPSWNCRTCTMEPLRDIMVTANEVIVTVDLPYAEQNTIEVKPIGKDTIEISAKMRRKISFDDFGITHHRVSSKDSTARREFQCQFTWTAWKSASKGAYWKLGCQENMSTKSQ